MKKIVVALLFCVHANAAMIDSFRFKGIVQSYDSENVRVLVKNRKVIVPKKNITAGNVKFGEKVSFQLTMAQMKKIFFEKETVAKN